MYLNALTECKMCEKVKKLIYLQEIHKIKNNIITYAMIFEEK